MAKHKPPQDPNKVREQDMLAVLFSCYRRHGRDPFRISAELSRVTLQCAARKGLLRIYIDQAWLTDEGVNALAPWLGASRGTEGSAAGPTAGTGGSGYAEGMEASGTAERSPARGERRYG